MKVCLGPPLFHVIFIATFAAFSMASELSEDEVTLLPPLPICDAYQACGAEVSVFPILLPNLEESEDTETTTITTTTTTTLDAGYQALIIEGSGEGSGAEFFDSPTPSTTVTNDVTVFPLYDEFVSGPAVFDYAADKNVTQKQLCRCPIPKDGENENTCSFTNTTNLINIDPSLKLAFCSPPSHSVRCIGRRNVIRVIAEIHESGEAIQSVLDTAVFCNCPNGFKRIGIEPWADGYAFKYQCK